MSDVALTWLGVADLILGEVPPEGAVVLLVDLADLRVEALPPLEPSPRDIQDAAKPIAGPRDHFLARRALLRRLVAVRLGVAPESVVIGHAEDGHPEVVEPDATLHVSVSAWGSLSAVALAPVPIGVDLEPLGDPREPVWDVLHARERGGVESIWKTQAQDWLFLSIWTAKEAYLKALGLGLKREPSRLHVNYKDEETFVVHDPEAQPHQRTGASCRGEIGSTPVVCSAILLPRTAEP